MFIFRCLNCSYRDLMSIHHILDPASIFDRAPCHTQRHLLRCRKIRKRPMATKVCHCTRKGRPSHPLCSYVFFYSGAVFRLHRLKHPFHQPYRIEDSNFSSALRISPFVVLQLCIWAAWAAESRPTTGATTLLGLALT